MLIVAVHASRAARQHMREKHRVELWEVEEALVGRRDVRRTRGDRYFCDVRTGDGRRLRVVFRADGTAREVEAHVVTAFAC